MIKTVEMLRTNQQQATSDWFEFADAITISFDLESESTGCDFAIEVSNAVSHRGINILQVFNVEKFGQVIDNQWKYYRVVINCNHSSVTVIAAV